MRLARSALLDSHIFSNKILIEREDLEKQLPHHYPNNYAGVDAN